MCAVSVVVTGTAAGLTRERLGAPPESERQERFAAARSKFESLGAHFVVDSTADLMPVIDSISERIARRAML
jgi:phosphonoacetaldehyde hydrolase